VPRGIVDGPLWYQDPTDDSGACNVFEPLRANLVFRADPVDAVVYSCADEDALGSAAAVVEQDHHVGLAGEIGSRSLPLRGEAGITAFCAIGPNRKVRNTSAGSNPIDLRAGLMVTAISVMMMIHAMSSQRVPTMEAPPAGQGNRGLRINGVE
jgi:hypothetical protein